MLRWIIPAIFAGILALLPALPLAWVAPHFVSSDVEALAPDMRFSGTIWNGRVTGLPYIQSANFNLSPLSRVADIEAGNGRNYIAGRMRASEATNVKLRADLASFPFTDGRLQGLQGDITATLDEVSYDKAGCLSATGRARTDVLQRNGGSIQWTGPELNGPLRCEDGALIADLSGEDAQQSVSALIRLVPDGSYRADITVRTSRAEADAVLPLFGFSRVGQDFKLTEQGRWR